MKERSKISFPIFSAGCALVLTAAASAYDNEDLRRDLNSPEPLIYHGATQKALEMPTPETVRDLMTIILSKEVRHRTPRAHYDEVYGAPRTHALLALSQLLPNPPATFSSDFNRGGMRGAQVHYLELFEAWWEKNRHEFEGKDAKMPGRRPDSLRNLSPEELEARERADYEKSQKLFLKLTWRQARRSGSTWDEIEDEYLEERRQARAAVRAIAKREAPPSESPIAAPDATTPPGTISGSGGTSPSAFVWVSALGFLALIAAVTAILLLRRKRAEASA